MRRAPIYLVSACSSGDEFVAAFRRYCDKNGLFVPIGDPLAIGRRAWFAVTLADGGVMIEGEAEVVNSARIASVVHGRVGMTLKFLEPDEASKTTLAELERARLAMKPAPPSVPPRPAAIPAEPRPVPPKPQGRIDAVNALAECVAIGDPEPRPAAAPAPAPTPVAAKPAAKIAVPAIPPRAVPNVRKASPSSDTVIVVPPAIAPGPVSDTMVAVAPPEAGIEIATEIATEVANDAVTDTANEPSTEVANEALEANEAAREQADGETTDQTTLPPPRTSTKPGAATPPVVRATPPAGMIAATTVLDTPTSITAVPMPVTMTGSAPTLVGGPIIEPVPSSDPAIPLPAGDSPSDAARRVGVELAEPTDVVSRPDAAAAVTSASNVHALMEQAGRRKTAVGVGPVAAVAARVARAARARDAGKPAPADDARWGESAGPAGREGTGRAPPEDASQEPTGRDQVLDGSVVAAADAGSAPVPADDPVSAPTPVQAIAAEAGSGAITADAVPEAIAVPVRDAAAPPPPPTPIGPLPSGDWTIARDPAAPDGWSEPFATVPASQLAEEVIGGTHPAAAQQRMSARRDALVEAEPKVQIDPTLIEPAIDPAVEPVSYPPVYPASHAAPAGDPRRTSDPALRPLPADGPLPPMSAPPMAQVMPMAQAMPPMMAAPPMAMMVPPIHDLPPDAAMMHVHASSPVIAPLPGYMLAQGPGEAPPMHMQMAVPQQSAFAPHGNAHGIAPPMHTPASPGYAMDPAYGMGPPPVMPPGYASDTALPAQASNRRLIIVLASALVAVLVGIVLLLVFGRRGVLASEPVPHATLDTSGRTAPKTTDSTGTVAAATEHAPGTSEPAPPTTPQAAVAAVGVVAPAAPVRAAQATPCPIEVRSIPNGAELVVGQIAFGKTPRKITLPCGERVELTFRKGKLPPVTRAITPSPAVTQLKVALNKPLHTVKLSSSPPGATITLNGRPLGVTPTTIKVPAGESSTLMLSKDGYETHAETVAPKGSGERVHTQLVRKR